MAVAATGDGCRALDAVTPAERLSCHVGDVDPRPDQLEASECRLDDPALQLLLSCARPADDRRAAGVRPVAASANSEVEPEHVSRLKGAVTCPGQAAVV